MSEQVQESALHRRRWLIMTVVSIGQLMIALDTTVASVMGPELQRDLGLSPTGLQWVFNCYIVLFGGLLLLGGRLNDVIGRRKMFVGGLVLFAVGSLLAALAHGRPVLATAADDPDPDLTDGETVLTIARRRDPSAIADAIRRLLDDPAGAARVGTAGAAFAATRDWPVIAAAHAGLYARVLGR